MLAEHPQIWIDADAFEQLLRQAHTSDDPEERERLLERASMLYGGAFLPEEGEHEWVTTRRSTLRRHWIGLLLDLADLRIEREAFNHAIELLERLLSVDPTNEAAVRRLISLLARLGRRAEALSVYQRLEALLRQEYRIAPLPELQALYEDIRASVYVRGGERSGSALSLEAEHDASVPEERLIGRTQEIEQLRQMLNAIEAVTHLRLA